MVTLILQGGEAFAAFRYRSLLEAIRGQAPSLNVDRFEARYVYLLHCVGALDAEELERTQALLGAGGTFSGKGGFFVTPRKGTISPWSSKATDIFRNCALAGVHRVERGVYFRFTDRASENLPLDVLQPVLRLLHDRMTQGVYADVSDIFDHMDPPPFASVDILGGGQEALEAYNRNMGLALSDEEIAYLYKQFCRAGRNPTDVELVMFGQVNSEHCRHKIFNAEWILDGIRQRHSLFDMIRHTHAESPAGTLVAYNDNSAVIEGCQDTWFEADPHNGFAYRTREDRVDIVLKVETHNHPTAIAPAPGAATGVGGEIRDEGATGRGARSKAGLSAFMVSNLRVPSFCMPWEREYAEFPSRLASPLEIMLDGPIGGARFGNEFGRPQLAGVFRTFEDMCAGRYRGYHKPIMVAGGMGNIKPGHIEKTSIPAEALIVQIGGPALRIGLGGGAASSMAQGTNAAELDYDSVQRDNAEMQRRCQELITSCVALGAANPILSIHDIGAGGLSNGCPELVSRTGGEFWLREIHNEDLSMSPMEIWCCEAQERYVLAIRKGQLDEFLDLCRRERCEVAVIGKATDDGRLRLYDKRFENHPIDMDLAVLLGKPPRMLREVCRDVTGPESLQLENVVLGDAVQRVLRCPCVADKTFLITITDRSVTGMVSRDQMAGPYQTPIADVAVTAASFRATTGEAMAMGERSPIALISGPASGRMAVGEALTNIAAARIGDIGRVKLSGNWMCACGEPGEDAALYETVRAVGLELCPSLGVSIPVGKDSLSMRSVWDDSSGKSHRMTAPLSLVISAFAPVEDVRLSVTPDLKKTDSQLIAVDLGQKRCRLGGSVLAQVYNQVGDECPDLDEPKLLSGFFAAIQELLARGELRAYHDRSDGGLLVTLAEMAFGGRIGVDVSLDALGSDPLSILFSEELGAVLEVDPVRVPRVMDVMKRHGLAGLAAVIGGTTAAKEVRFDFDGKEIFHEEIASLHRAWSELTSRMQALRDNPECVCSEYDALLDEKDEGIRFHVAFDPTPLPVPSRAGGTRPRVAILREQGINGHVEMAAAFDKAGFESVDVHMTDLLSERLDLKEFEGLVACGGFSYGDVLGAGSGWAKSILYNVRLRDAFAEFFARSGTFSLGVCNGCQMMSQLKAIIPGAESWPAFTRNRSEQFEARYVTVEILPSPSILLKGMAGSRLAIPVAHGEGFANFDQTGSLEAARVGKQVAMRYVDSRGTPVERYPLNPNGSPEGITSLTTVDGRVTIMMPHPERGFRSVQMSYRPDGLFEGEEGPWMRLFENARAFVG